MSRKLVTTLTAVFSLSILLGIALGWSVVSPSTVPVALAISCPANGTCAGGDTTKTSNIFVEHVGTSGGNQYAVMPDTGETWNITARWKDGRAGFNCAIFDETASVTVSWNGSSWVLSNQNYTAHIIGFSLCSHGTGCSGASLGTVFGYRLLVNLTDPANAGVANLDTVLYETTNVDDGNLILGGLTPCSNLGSTVSPNSQYFTTTDAPVNDWADGRCPFSCSASNGPTVTLTYQ